MTTPSCLVRSTRPDLESLGMVRMRVSAPAGSVVLSIRALARSPKLKRLMCLGRLVHAGEMRRLTRPGVGRGFGFGRQEWRADGFLQRIYVQPKDCDLWQGDFEPADSGWGREIMNANGNGEQEALRRRSEARRRRGNPAAWPAREGLGGGHGRPEQNLALLYTTLILLIYQVQLLTTKETFAQPRERLWAK